MNNNFGRRKPGGAAAALGVLLVVAGIAYMLKLFGLLHFNIQLWPLFIIFGGLMNGIKHRFRNPGAYIMLFVGIAFLVPEFTVFGKQSSDLVWPLALIAAGIFVVFRPKNKCRPYWNARRMPGYPAQNAGRGFYNATAEHEQESVTNKDGFLVMDAVFGGRKEIITSKQFKGATISAICGGLELNLMQADSDQQPMIIDLKVICGGIEIVVPSHWEIVNELDVLFSGIDDKRYIRTDANAPARTLVLRGSVTLGGVDIKSY